MIYEFAAKIKDVNKDEMLVPETGSEAVAELMRSTVSAFEISLRHDVNMNRDVMVKGKTSVTSYTQLHEIELERAIEQFKSHLEEIAQLIDGKISEDEAFYNNSKDFSKLYY